MLFLISRIKATSFMPSFILVLTSLLLRCPHLLNTYDVLDIVLDTKNFKLSKKFLCLQRFQSRRESKLYLDQCKCDNAMNSHSGDPHTTASRRVGARSCLQVRSTVSNKAGCTAHSCTQLLRRGCRTRECGNAL